MHRNWLHTGFPLILLSIWFSVVGAAAADPAQTENKIKHRFLAVDQGKYRLLYVDQFHPENDWAIDVPARPRDSRLVDEGKKVLMSHNKGAAEYELKTGKRTWIIDSHNRIESADRLLNGNTLLAGNSPQKDSPQGIYLYEVDSTGKELSKVVVAGKKDVHIVQRLKNGNTLLTHNELKKGDQPSWIIEVDPKGKIVWEAEIPGAADDVKRLENGHTIAPTGDKCTIVELDKTGKIVANYAGEQAHPKVGIKWLGSLQILKNGNMVASNWLGHGVPLVGPHIVEFDRSNKLVWSWEDHTRANKIHNVLVLE